MRIVAGVTSTQRMISEIASRKISSNKLLRLLLEDLPKNHNLILMGQPELLVDLDLAVNLDLKSRVTYSVITKRLHDDAMQSFVQRELDRISLAHNTFTAGATVTDLALAVVPASFLA